MATVNERLADALEKLREAEHHGIVQHHTLSRTYRERLQKAGFLEEIIKGWYRISNPGALPGETSWFPFYWEFVSQYLASRFGGDYCLNAEGSLLLHAETNTIPRQLILINRSGIKQAQPLPGGLSLLTYHEENTFPDTVDRKRGLNVLPLAQALIQAPEGFFRNRPDEAVILLSTISDPTPLLSILLDAGRTTIAGRLAGAFRANHQLDIADRISSIMERGGYQIRETNPFDRPTPEISPGRDPSPYELRIRAMWSRMRSTVIDAFPPAPGIPADPDDYLRHVDDQYRSDAYHSLSIEGYQVTPELIERVRSGEWNPDKVSLDAQSRDALAARGYYEAFLEVRLSVSKILKGADLGIVRSDHREWFGSLFQPAVRASIIKASDLAGYRNHPVFIHGSLHVPPSAENVGSAMATLFDLLESEPSAAVRAVLGHFIFVFIHPYGDGNGRLGRFLMNTMLASGGYPWTIVHVQRRAEYMAALEAASVKGEISPLAEFLASELARA